MSILLYILLIVSIANVMGIIFAFAFGDSKTFKAIDEKIAKWIRGERSK